MVYPFTKNRLKMFRYILLFIVITFPTYRTAIAALGQRHILFSKNVYDSKAESFKKAYLLVKDGVILSIQNNYQKKKDDVYYDYSSQYIIPGLIDAHTHLFLTDNSYDKDFPIELIKNSKQDPKERKSLGKNRAMAYLKGGFTTVRDLGNSGYFLAKSLSEQSRSLKNKIPRIFFSGPGLCVLKCQFHHHASDYLVNKEYKVINEKTDIDKVINFYKEMKVSQIKIYLDNIPSTGFMGEKLLEKILASVKKFDLKVAAHAIDTESIKLAMKYKIHTLEHGYDLNSNHFSNFYQKNTILVPTDLGIPEQLSVLKNQIHFKKERVKQQINDYIRKRGGRLVLAKENSMRIAFGSDFYFPVKEIENDFIVSIRNSIYLFKKFGFSNKEILRFLTTNAAKALSTNKIGSIVKNNFADFLILNKNPINDIKAIEDINSIFLNGERIN